MRRVCSPLLLLSLGALADVPRSLVLIVTHLFGRSESVVLQGAAGRPLLRSKCDI